VKASLKHAVDERAHESGSVSAQVSIFFRLRLQYDYYYDCDKDYDFMIVSLQLCLILNLHPAPTVASLPSLAAPKRERPRPATVGKKLGLARVRLAKVTVAEVCSCMLAPTLLLQYQTLAEAEQS
jgi:hypothetical protein